jgi:hypothetical protein
MKKNDPKKQPQGATPVKPVTPQKPETAQAKAPGPTKR